MLEKSPVPREGLSGRATRRVVIGSFVGALMEWYDFFAFSMAAGLIFSSSSYPNSDSFTGLIASLTTLGVGFLTRPLGGIVFGHFGDKIGRKTTLIWALATVGCSTFLIGFIPTYQEIGIWAPPVLMVLRLIQSFGLGGEYRGAALTTIEPVLGSRRGFLGSLPQTAASVGITLATGTLALCNHFPTLEQLPSWGWRIPFWLSATMSIAGLFTRLHTEETLDFQK